MKEPETFSSSCEGTTLKCRAFSPISIKQSRAGGKGEQTWEGPPNLKQSFTLYETGGRLTLPTWIQCTTLWSFTDHVLPLSPSTALRSHPTGAKRQICFFFLSTAPPHTFFNIDFQDLVPCVPNPVTRWNRNNGRSCPPSCPKDKTTFIHAWGDAQELFQHSLVEVCSPAGETLLLNF